MKAFTTGEKTSPSQNFKTINMDQLFQTGALVKSLNNGKSSTALLFLYLFGPEEEKKDKKTQISSSKFKPHLIWSSGRHTQEGI